MLRNYKIYHKEDKKYYDVIIINFEEQCVQYKINGELGVIHAWDNLDNIILLEGTRIFDKNEIEIFEGHLIKFIDGNRIYKIEFDKDLGMYVRTDLQFTDMKYPLVAYDNKHYEIVGYIHEQENIQNT